MNSINNPVLLCEDDYNLLKPYFSKADNVDNEMSLAAELSRATVVKNEDLPNDVVRINSIVDLLDVENDQIMQLQIVMPAHANIQEKKISITSPIAAAIIGFRKGYITEWEVPAGLKKFKIVDVK